MNQQLHEKAEELRQEIELGWNSPVSSKSVKDIVDELDK